MCSGLRSVHGGEIKKKSAAFQMVHIHVRHTQAKDSEKPLKLPRYQTEHISYSMWVTFQRKIHTDACS